MRKENTLPDTLAEFVLLVSKRGKSRAHDTLKRVAREIPFIPRLGWTSKFVEIAHSTKSIETEEIIGQLPRASFPFDKFWVEGPTFLTNHDQRFGDTLDQVRVGAYVEADQENNRFKFILIKELLHAEDNWKSAGLSKHPEAIYSINNVSVVCEFDDFTTVSPEVGVDLNEDKLLDQLGVYQQAVDMLASRGFIMKGIEKIIDDHYIAADFLSRFFVLLYSDRAKNNLEQVKSQDLSELHAKNRRLMKAGGLPRVPVAYVTIDISEEDTATLQTDKPNLIRRLLGWTLVRRSKEILSKYGVIFRRKPHERKIPSPADRRMAMKVVDASEPVELSLEGDRPALIKTQKNPTPEA